MADWLKPISMQFKESGVSDSYRSLKEDETVLPLPPHPGAFGVQRKHHVHEGVDLYCPVGTSVFAVEEGTVVARQWFTGAKAGSPWWHDTEAVLIEGKTGVVVYGEISTDLQVGERVHAGQKIGQVLQVLKNDKGRPVSMLHLELHAHGTRDTYEWKDMRPQSLCDPTPFLR